MDLGTELPQVVDVFAGQLKKLKQSFDELIEEAAEVLTQAEAFQKEKTSTFHSYLETVKIRRGSALLWKAAHLRDVKDALVVAGSQKAREAVDEQLRKALSPAVTSSTPPAGAAGTGEMVAAATASGAADDKPKERVDGQQVDDEGEKKDSEDSGTAEAATQAEALAKTDTSAGPVVLVLEQTGAEAPAQAASNSIDKQQMSVLLRLLVRAEGEALQPVTHLPGLRCYTELDREIEKIKEIEDPEALSNSKKFMKDAKFHVEELRGGLKKAVGKLKSFMEQADKQQAKKEATKSKDEEKAAVAAAKKKAKKAATDVAQAQLPTDPIFLTDFKALVDGGFAKNMTIAPNDDSVMDSSTPWVWKGADCVSIWRDCPRVVLTFSNYGGQYKKQYTVKNPWKRTIPSGHEGE